MKKLLALLGALGIAASGASSAVACDEHNSNAQNYNNKYTNDIQSTTINATNDVISVTFTNQTKGERGFIIKNVVDGGPSQPFIQSLAWSKDYKNATIKLATPLTGDVSLQYLNSNSITVSLYREAVVTSASVAKDRYNVVNLTTNGTHILNASQMHVYTRDNDGHQLNLNFKLQNANSITLLTEKQFVGGKKVYVNYNKQHEFTLTMPSVEMHLTKATMIPSTDTQIQLNFNNGNVQPNAKLLEVKDLTDDKILKTSDYQFDNLNYIVTLTNQSLKLGGHILGVAYNHSAIQTAEKLDVPVVSPVLIGVDANHSNVKQIALNFKDGNINPLVKQLIIKCQNKVLVLNQDYKFDVNAKSIIFNKAYATPNNTWIIQYDKKVISYKMPQIDTKLMPTQLAPKTNNQFMLDFTEGNTAFDINKLIIKSSGKVLVANKDYKLSIISPLHAKLEILNPSLQAQGVEFACFFENKLLGSLTNNVVTPDLLSVVPQKDSYLKYDLTFGVGNQDLTKIISNDDNNLLKIVNKNNTAVDFTVLPKINGSNQLTIKLDENNIVAGDSLAIIYNGKKIQQEIQIPKIDIKVKDLKVAIGDIQKSDDDSKPTINLTGSITANNNISLNNLKNLFIYNANNKKQKMKISLKGDGQVMSVGKTYNFNSSIATKSDSFDDTIPVLPGTILAIGIFKDETLIKNFGAIEVPKIYPNLKTDVVIEDDKPEDDSTPINPLKLHLKFTKFGNVELTNQNLLVFDENHHPMDSKEYTVTDNWDSSDFQGCTVEINKKNIKGGQKIYLQITGQPEMVEHTILSVNPKFWSGAFDNTYNKDDKTITLKLNMGNAAQFDSKKIVVSMNDANGTKLNYKVKSLKLDDDEVTQDITLSLDSKTDLEFGTNIYVSYDNITNTTIDVF